MDVAKILIKLGILLLELVVINNARGGIRMDYRGRLI